MGVLVGISVMVGKVSNTASNKYENKMATRTSSAADASSLFHNDGLVMGSDGRY